MDDSDDLTDSVLVSLGSADDEHDATGLELDIIQRQGGQLGAAHRRGVAEQDQRGVAGTQSAASVDVLDDLADVVGAEGTGLAAWLPSRLALRPRQSPTFWARCRPASRCRSCRGHAITSGAVDQRSTNWTLDQVPKCFSGSESVDSEPEIRSGGRI